MPVKTVDDTGLSPSQITSLKQNGITTVGRYLSHSTWKALSLGEVANLKAAGMQIFSVYESNPTKASYFSAVKGKSDALDAINLAKAIGQPTGTAIYFTVDYDAQSNDLANILSYFQAIRNNLTGYKVGAYGSVTVLNYLHQNNAADYWFQTVAWSSGQRCSFLNIYQSQCDTKFAGISVDIDELLTSDVGAWGQPKPAPQPTPAPIKHEAITPPKPIVPPSSSKTTGKWTKINSVWYYVENGKNRVGWLNDGGKWYYLDDKTSAMCVSWKQVNGKWYFFDVHGVMQTGWVTSKNKKYYLNDKGQMVTGQQTIDGVVHTFDVNGALVN